jgi:hypothetical protein
MNGRVVAWLLVNDAAQLRREDGRSGLLQLVESELMPLPEVFSPLPTCIPI